MMTTYLRRALVAAGAVTMGASVAIAQQGRVATVDPRTVPELKAEFERAVKLGLDVEPLDTKAREGYLKQASPKVIREKVHDFADLMVEARDALKPARSTAEIVAGVGALQADIPARVLRKMRESQRNRSLEVPLGALTDLVARGVPLLKAVPQVESMLKSNVPDTQIATLASLVQSDVAQGVAPTVAFELRSKGVLSLPQAPVAGVAAPAVRPPPR